MDLMVVLTHRWVKAHFSNRRVNGISSSISIRNQSIDSIRDRLLSSMDLQAVLSSSTLRNQSLLHHCYLCPALISFVTQVKLSFLGVPVSLYG